MGLTGIAHLVSGCTFVHADGRPCRLDSRPGTLLCPLHSPGYRKAQAVVMRALTAAAKEGMVEAKATEAQRQDELDAVEPVGIESAEDVKAVALLELARVRADRTMSARDRAQAVSGLLRIIQTTLPKADLEARIAELEALAGMHR